MKTSLLHALVILLFLGMALTVIYYANLAYQSSLGRKALTQMGLTPLSLDEALHQAQDESKQVLLDVSAIWCPTCRTLDQYVFADPQVQQAIKDRYVFARLEYASPEGTAFLKEHQATGYPNLWILDRYGNVVQQLPVVLTAERFLGELPGPVEN
jgi:thiol:disulfide interchange protein